MSNNLSLAEIRKIEEGLFANRPCLKTVTDKDWVWRFANGYTGRANSLQSLNVSDHKDYKNRLARHWQRSTKHSIIPRFRVTPLTPPKVIDALNAQGFVAKSNTLVMVKGLESESFHTTPKLKAQAWDVSNEYWQREIIRLEKLDAQDAKSFVYLLRNLPKNSLGLTIGEKGKPAIGSAYASCVNTLGSVFAVIVEPDQRGKGIGKILMQQLLCWLEEHGVKEVALQVVADNRPAISLYHAFGFKNAYKYHYLVQSR